MGGESSPPSAFTLKTANRVPPPLPGPPDGSGISSAPRPRQTPGLPALCWKRNPAEPSPAATARRVDVRNPWPDRGEVPAGLRRGRPAASAPRSAPVGACEPGAPSSNSSACRRASGDEAQDPRSSARPAEPRRDAGAEHSDARPVLAPGPAARKGPLTASSGSGRGSGPGPGPREGAGPRAPTGAPGRRSPLQPAHPRDA